MTSIADVEPPPRQSPGRRLSTFFIRHRALPARRAARRAARLAARRLPRVALPAPARVVLGASEGFTEPTSSHTGTSTTSARSSRSPSTATSRGGRSAWPRLVTIADAVLAFPIAYYMARVASPRTRNLLVVAVLTPLWASYLVKAYRLAHDARRGRRRQLAARAVRALRAGRLVDGPLAHVHVPLAAVHDPADLRGPRADPGLVARGIGRPRRAARCGRSGR